MFNKMVDEHNPLVKVMGSGSGYTAAMYYEALCNV